MALNDEIVSTTSIENLKTIAGSTAFAMAQIAQNNMTHLKSMDHLREGFLSTALERFSTTDPKEAMGINSLARAQADSGISSLLAQLSAGHIGGKVAQSFDGSAAMEIAKLSAAISSINQNNGAVIQAINALGNQIAAMKS